MDSEEDDQRVVEQPETVGDDVEDYERGIIYLRSALFTIIIDRRAIPRDDFQIQLPSSQHYLPLAAGPLNQPEATVAHDQVAQEILRLIEHHIHPVHRRSIEARVEQIDLNNVTTEQISTANNEALSEVKTNPCMELTKEVVGFSLYFFAKLLEKIVLDYSETLGGTKTRVILERCLEAFKQNVVGIVQRHGGWDAVMNQCISKVVEQPVATFLVGVAIGVLLTFCVMKTITK